MILYIETAQYVKVMNLISARLIRLNASQVTVAEANRTIPGEKQWKP